LKQEKLTSLTRIISSFLHKLLVREREKPGEGPGFLVFVF